MYGTAGAFDRLSTVYSSRRKSAVATHWQSGLKCWRTDRCWSISWQKRFTSARQSTEQDWCRRLMNGLLDRLSFATSASAAYSPRYEHEVNNLRNNRRRMSYGSVCQAIMRITGHSWPCNHHIWACIAVSVCWSIRSKHVSRQRWWGQSIRRNTEDIINSWKKTLRYQISLICCVREN